MKFLDKIKDLFSDEEEVIETKEVEVEENEEHKLPTFMRNKIEEEQKREEDKKQKEEKDASEMISDREIVRTRSNSSFSFPIEMDEREDYKEYDVSRYSKQNVLMKEKEKSVAELYNKKEEVKPKRFRPTPVISPVYGILDKNYTKDEVKVQDENSYEIQRPSRKVDFETVRNKAFGSLTDDIKNNLCESCELYQEVKITKNADKKLKKEDDNLLSDMTDDSTLGEAEENYFDFGVSYEPPKREEKRDHTLEEEKKQDKVKLNIETLEDTEIEDNEVKIVNHNDEESSTQKIEIKELEEENKEKILEDTKEFEKLTHEEEDITSILGGDDDIPLNSDSTDIFNLIDSMYDEEEK